MFGFKKKKGNDLIAVAPGTIKALQDVEDQVFSQGLIGQGCAIIPQGDTIYAPIAGTLTVVFPTGHAFGITGEDGLEYLLHIGIDTVNLKGEGFTLLVEQGQKIHQGDPLVKVDFALIKEKGYPIDTLILITSPKEQYEWKMIAQYNHQVQKDDVIFHCEKCS